MILNCTQKMPGEQAFSLSSFLPVSILSMSIMANFRRRPSSGGFENGFAAAQIGLW